MRLTITIQCTPKPGRADRLHDTVQTDYHQEDNE